MSSNISSGNQEIIKQLHALYAQSHYRACYPAPGSREKNTSAFFLFPVHNLGVYYSPRTAYESRFCIFTLNCDSRQQHLIRGNESSGAEL